MSGLPEYGDRHPACRRMPRPSAYALIQDASGRIAIVKTPEVHVLPGGAIEDGESPEEAARRETREEAGLVVTPGRLVWRTIELVHSARRQACYEKRCSFFEAGIVARESPEEEGHELLWLRTEQALSLLRWESHRQAVLRWRREPAADKSAGDEPTG